MQEKKGPTVPTTFHRPKAIAAAAASDGVMRLDWPSDWVTAKTFPLVLLRQCVRERLVDDDSTREELK